MKVKADTTESKSFGACINRQL